MGSFVYDDDGGAILWRFSLLDELGEGAAVKIRLLPSDLGSDEKLHFLTTFLIDDVLAIDAGSLGFAALEVQRGIQEIFLTHSHMDHLATLPIHCENRLVEERPSGLVVRGHAQALEVLDQNLFNDLLWPDFSRIHYAGEPLIAWSVLNDEEPVHVQGLTVTPVLVNHAIPTFGFIIDDTEGRVVISGDTGPTERIWDLCCEGKEPDIVFVECSFPNRLERLARESGHLTPALLREEIEKVPPASEIVAYHLKPAFHDEIVRELAALSRESLSVANSKEEKWIPCRKT
ncbi:MAG TPA: MBL fold metallo-hydrolase [Planctomycetes bacterium]|nr:MBL fold metallo-hydrolase [Planctomycetota bacterium]